MTNVRLRGTSLSWPPCATGAATATDGAEARARSVTAAPAPLILRNSRRLLRFRCMEDVSSPTMPLLLAPELAPPGPFRQALALVAPPAATVKSRGDLGKRLPTCYI